MNAHELNRQRYIHPSPPKLNPKQIEVDGLVWKLQGHGFEVIPVVRYEAQIGTLGGYPVIATIIVSQNQPIDLAVVLDDGRDYPQLLESTQPFSGPTFEQVARKIVDLFTASRAKLEELYGGT